MNIFILATLCLLPAACVGVCMYSKAQCRQCTLKTLSKVYIIIIFSHVKECTQCRLTTQQPTSTAACNARTRAPAAWEKRGKEEPNRMRAATETSRWSKRKKEYVHKAPKNSLRCAK